MKTVLEIKDLCKTYVTNKIQNNVLKNVNFNVEEGDLVAIMGPSGSGKSTLLYTASGMDDLTAGDSIFCGKSIKNMEKSELSEMRLDDMGFIFQQMYMLKNLSIMDNILLPSFQSKANTKSRKEKIDYAKGLMNKFDIMDVADNDINEVSGGQLQRACICRSMVNSPKIIFADEPTGALNRSNSDTVMEELIKINNEGTTIMLVTHDSKVAAKCKRVLYIRDGEIAGEYTQSAYSESENIRDRERALNNWLMEMGW